MLIVVNNETANNSLLSIDKADQDKRIDVFLAEQVKDLTRSRCQSLIRDGHVKVNELPVKTSYRLKAGDYISLFIPPASPYRLKPEPVDFTIIH